MDFSVILKRAEDRKGGPAELRALLPASPPREALLTLGDDRVLSAMARRIFSAGFSWSVIDAKWPGFEEAFEGFDPGRLALADDSFWDRLTGDARIVRNGAKIAAVRENAAFVLRVAGQHGSFGRFLYDWPADDEIGLLDLLSRQGSRLGGHTGQMLLRFLGWDAFVTSADVAACLIDAGLDIAPNPTSKKDLARIQAQFNAWATETGLPYAHLSRICALSIGSNTAGSEQEP